MFRPAGLSFCTVALLSACVAATQPDGPDRPRTARVELLETYWRPVEIDGKPAVIHAGTREPHIALARDGARVQGFTGCNSLGGTYSESAGSLRFSKLAMTRMACLAEAANAQEAAFTRALDATAVYRIDGNMLDLRDAGGTPRMRLEAR